MALKEVICHQCQKSNTYSERLGFREVCLFCGADLHVCLSCEFYDLKSYQECREPQAERVKEKDRANRCEYFSPRSTNSENKGPSKEDLIAAAEALFSKKN
jgi:hypothetical protein